MLVKYICTFVLVGGPVALLVSTKSNQAFHALLPNILVFLRFKNIQMLVMSSQTPMEEYSANDFMHWVTGTMSVGSGYVEILVSNIHDVLRIDTNNQDSRQLH
jgi:hypothetical protein